MTIGAIILDAMVLMVIIFFVLGTYVSFDSISSVVITTLLGVIVMAVIIGGQLWYYNNSESGKRALKTQASNYNQGITRKVQVYDINGKLIKEYKGKFDLEYDNDRILFDDEKGKRHIIYYSISTVIIDEEDNESNK